MAAPSPALSSHTLDVSREKMEALGGRAKEIVLRSQGWTVSERGTDHPISPAPSCLIPESILEATNRLLPPEPYKAACHHFCRPRMSSVAVQLLSINWLYENDTSGSASRSVVANSDTVDWVTVAAVGTYCKTKWRKAGCCRQGIDMFLGLSD